MKDQDKTREQLVSENEELRRRVAAMECVEAERSRSEKELRRNEAKWRSVAENAPVFVAVVDRSGKMQFLNHFQPGFDPATVLGRPIYDFFQPQYHAVARNCLEQVFQTGQPAFYECVGAGPEGSISEYGTHVGPVVVEGEIIAATLISRDITDRKRAEEALQKAHDELEEKVKQRTAELARANDELAIFRKVVESSGEGFSMADLDGHLTYLNPALCRMLGEERPEDRIGQHLSICYPEESNRRGKQEIEPVLMREGHWQGELPMLSCQGKTIPTWHNAFLIRDDNGSPLRLAVVIADMTERKQAEDALRISEEKYRSVVEACPDAIVMSDLNGQVVFASRQTGGLLGLADSDELVGRSVFDYVIENDRKRLAGNMANAVDVGVRRSTEYTSLRQNGTTTPVEASSVVIRDATGQPKAVMAVIRDITGRKQAEEALRRSEERLRLAQQVARVGTFEWDVQTGVNTWTPELEALYGLSPGSFPKTEPAWENLIYADDRAEALQRRKHTLETGQPVEGEWRVVWPDGSVHWLTGRWQAFKDESNKPLRLIGVNIDITRRKRVEEALERERQSLWRMLQASDHERQTISYEIHDGLAQYLAAAGMQFQVFDGLRESNPDEAKKAYDAATQLVSQAHFEARRLISEVRPPVIDESGLETAISHLVHEQRRRGGPKIECHSDVQFGRLPSILENAIYRIVQEALTNACKHSKSKKVTVTMVQEGQDVRLEVRDWGIGFDPQPVGEGHFGLESIRQRVRLLGGRVAIESTLGSGTLVQVVVPILEKRNNG
jgi:PAS domain S-box-containing protein